MFIRFNNEAFFLILVLLLDTLRDRPAKERIASFARRTAKLNRITREGGNPCELLELLKS